MQQNVGRASRRAGSAFLLLAAQGLGLDALAQGGPAVTESVVVKGTKEQQRASDPVQGYKADRSTLGSRTDSRLLDIPQSVSVVPQDLIADRQATDLPRALETVPGLVKQGTVLGGGYFNLNARGFAISEQSSYRLDGSTFYLFDQPLLETIERVEVLRGPATVYGRMASPGGLINLVSKLPLDAPARTLNLRLGPSGSRNLHVDLSGPLLEHDGVLAYRVIAGGQDGRSFREGSHNNYRFASASLRWRFADNGHFTVRVDHRDIDRNQDNGLVALPNAATNPTGYTIPNIPASRLLNQPWAYHDSVSSTYTHILDVQLSPAWRLEHRFGRQDFARERLDGTPTAVAPNGTYRYSYTDRRNEVDLYSGNVDLIGQLDIGGMRHKLLFGADLTRYDFRSREPVSAAFTCNSSVFAPVACAQPARGAVIELRPTIENNYKGWYAQDQITLTPALDLVIGARRDLFQERSIAVNNATAVLAAQPWQRNDSTNHRAGLVHRVREDLSVYASYGESFRPNGVVTNANYVNEGQALAPESGRLHEIGAKYAPRQSRLALSASVFQIAKRNVVYNDTVNRIILLNGEERSQGLELEAIGDVLPGLRLSAGYAYLDEAEVVTSSTAAFVGRRLTKAPRHAGSLWGHYDFQGGAAKGWSLGLGVFARGSMFIDGANLAQVPGYGRIDMTAAYRFDAIGPIGPGSIRLNVNNLSGRRYIASANGLTEIEPGAPRSATLSGSFSF